MKETLNLSTFTEKKPIFLEFDLQMTSKSYTVTFSVRQTGVF